MMGIKEGTVYIAKISISEIYFPVFFHPKCLVNIQNGVNFISFVFQVIKSMKQIFD